MGELSAKFDTLVKCWFLSLGILIVLSGVLCVHLWGHA